MTTIRWSWDPYTKEIVFRDTNGKEARHTLAAIRRVDPDATEKALAKMLPNVVGLVMGVRT